MGIKEILEVENANAGSINLFKEGIFWRVYQKSAYLFTKHIKDLKAIKKFYKNVNSEVVYAGFPDTILPRIEMMAESKNFKFEKCNEKHCSISGFEPDNGFEEWFKSIPPYPVPDKLYLVGKTPPQQNLEGLTHEIIQKIKEYQVSNKTPLETVNFDFASHFHTKHNH